MTLPRFFAVAIGLLAVLAALVLGLSVRTSSAAVLRVGESARVARAAQVVTAVESDLGAAEKAVEDFERALAEGVVDDDEPVSVQRYLTAELIALRGLTELTLTSARLEGYDEAGEARLGSGERRQLSLFRDAGGGIGHRFDDRVAAGSPGDPTTHDTFRAAAHRDARGQALWSDLAFAEHDGGLPAEARRKTMTVQKAIFVRDRNGTDRFVGVLRAGIVSGALDRLGAAPPPGDPHRLFLCDANGRLITRLAPDDPYVVVDQQGRPDPDGDLRVMPRATPPPVAAALAFARAGGTGGERMLVSGVPYLVSLLPVAEGRAQQWLAGVVVPESHYVGPLAAARDRLLVLLGVVVVAIGIVGLIGARTVGRGVRALVRSTDAMRRFSFEAAPEVTSPFREVRGALESVERAKTALRAMVKYVPIDLVRRLYESGRDPVLGAELEVVLLDVLAVVPLRPREAEQAFLQDRIGAVPEREREAEAPLAVADAEQPVLAPAVGPAAGVIVREIVPASPVGRVVLAHRAPLALGEVRPETLPVALPALVLLQPCELGFGPGRRLRPILVPHAGPYAGRKAGLHV